MLDFGVMPPLCTLVHYKRIIWLSSDIHVLILAKNSSVLQKWSSRPRLWSSQPSCLGFSQQCYYSTQEAEKPPEEEPLHNIINDTESVEGGANICRYCFITMLLIKNLNAVLLPFHAGDFSKHEFQAETKKLLDIVARSLYSEKEVSVYARERGREIIQALGSRFGQSIVLWSVSHFPTRSLSGSWSPMAAMLWRNCVTDWWQPVETLHRWRSICRPMVPRVPSPFRFNIHKTHDLLSPYCLVTVASKNL